GADPDTIMVEDAMTANVLTLDPESSVEEAARLMRAERIGAVPIVSHHRLVGIVTRSDVLEAYLTLAEAQTRAASTPVTPLTSGRAAGPGRRCSRRRCSRA